MTTLPKTGEPPDGSLPLIGLALVLAGVFSYRFAKVRQPTAIPAADKPDPDDS